MGPTKTNHQKFHPKAILGNIGLILFIPAAMSFISLIIALIFKLDSGKCTKSS